MYSDENCSFWQKANGFVTKLSKINHAVCLCLRAAEVGFLNLGFEGLKK